MIQNSTEGFNLTSMDTLIVAPRHDLEIFSIY